jgi:uncharacterized protein YkvS
MEIKEIKTFVFKYHSGVISNPDTENIVRMNLNRWLSEHIDRINEENIILDVTITENGNSLSFENTTDGVKGELTRYLRERYDFRYNNTNLLWGHNH